MSAYELTISGFGGQGVLLIGQLLAYAVNKKGKNVSWLPSYGPEMRGGTANCMVVVSDEEVNSPHIITPTAVVALNKPSVERFGAVIKPGGLLVVNTDMADQDIERSDINIVRLAAGSIAEKLGSSKVVNMAALGAFIKASGLVSLETAIECLSDVIPSYRSNMIAINTAALTAGYDAVSVN